jgi:hypothetical protein
MYNIGGILSVQSPEFVDGLDNELGMRRDG